jgi:O-antigen/teichoic acid export membrane protein
VFQLGLYGFSRRIFQLLTDVLAGPLNSVSFSLLASLQHDHVRRREAFLFATFLSAVLSFPVFAGLAVVADALVPVVFGDHWIGAEFALQAFGAIGVLASIGVLQSSLINAQGGAEVWFVYLLIKQVVTVVYVLLFYPLGLDALMVSLVVLNYVMWVPSLFIVARILDLPVLRYVSSFAVPVIATTLMLVAVEAIHLMGPSWPTGARLIVSVAAGAAIYATTVLMLARDQLARMRDIVLK